MKILLIALTLIVVQRAESAGSRPMNCDQLIGAIQNLETLPAQQLMGEAKRRFASEGLPADLCAPQSLIYQKMEFTSSDRAKTSISKVMVLGNPILNSGGSSGLYAAMVMELDSGNIKMSLVNKVVTSDGVPRYFVSRDSGKIVFTKINTARSGKLSSVLSGLKLKLMQRYAFPFVINSERDEAIYFEFTGGTTLGTKAELSRFVATESKGTLEAVFNNQFIGDGVAGDLSVPPAKDIAIGALIDFSVLK